MILENQGTEKTFVCKRFYTISFGKKRVKTGYSFFVTPSLFCQFNGAVG
jgi:hypothetical protein